MVVVVRQCYSTRKKRGRRRRSQTLPCRRGRRVKYAFYISHYIITINIRSGSRNLLYMGASARTSIITGSRILYFLTFFKTSIVSYLLDLGVWNVPLVA